MNTSRTSRRTGEGLRPGDEPATPTGPVRAPLALAGVFLLGLLVVHIVVDARTDAIRDEIATEIVPARARVQAIEIALARQGMSLRGYLMTRDADFLERYGLWLAKERRHVARLRRHAEAIGPLWPARVDALHEATVRLHERVGRSGVLSADPPTPEARPLPLEPQTMALVTAIADELYGDLVRHEQERWADVAAIRRLDIALTGTLVILALGMTILIGRTSRRARRLATQLRRRAGEDLAFRRIARDLAAASGPDDVARTIADGGLGLTGSAAAYVERILPGQDEVTVAAAAGTDAPRVGERAPYSGSLTERIHEVGEAEYFPRIKDLRAPMISRLAETCARCGALVVPLIANGRGLGTFVLIRGVEQRAFDPGELARIHILADFAALALFRTILLQEAEQRRHAEAVHAAEANRQRHEVERLMRGKARFIRGFSHDLKNPLGAIIGYAELLEGGYKGALTDGQKESVHRIREAARVSLRLINDLVDLSRAEAGRLMLEPKSFDAVAIVRAATEEHWAQAEAAGLQLEAAMPERLPRAWADPDRVHQILGNLLSNAVKYTGRGGRIRVDSEVRSATVRGRTARWIVVHVTDTGPGIRVEDRERIFEEFARVEGRRAGGAGLGLAISRRIARLMDGDVTVRSEVGRGSTFSLWLPLAAGAESGATRAA